jgi:hypothetical protein
LALLDDPLPRPDFGGCIHQLQGKEGQDLYLGKWSDSMSECVGRHHSRQLSRGRVVLNFLANKVFDPTGLAGEPFHSSSFCCRQKPSGSFALVILM